MRVLPPLVLALAALTACGAPPAAPPFPIAVEPTNAPSPAMNAPPPASSAPAPIEAPPATEVPRAVEPDARGGPRVDIDAASGVALLRWLDGAATGVRPESVDRLVRWIAFATATTEESVTEEIDRTRTAVAGAEPAAEEARKFTFDIARRFRAESEDAITRSCAALASRRDVIGSRVARLLPDPSVARVPLDVIPVAGLPELLPALVAAEGERRLLLVDARAMVRRVLGPLPAAPARGPATRRFGDALGEELERVVAPELFHLAFGELIAASDRWRTWPMHDPLARAWITMLDEGVGALLELPREQAIDERGLRPPQIDAAARRAFERFETNLARLQDENLAADARARLEWSMWNGTGPLVDAPRTEDDRWGTRVVLRMAEAVDKLGPPGRLRDVLAKGPFELIEAYVEICGRTASVPPLGDDAKDALRALARTIEPR